MPAPVAVPIGVVLIVAFAAAASLAQASRRSSLPLRWCSVWAKAWCWPSLASSGVGRGLAAAMLAAALDGRGQPVRWKVRLHAPRQPAPQQLDLLVDLLVSIAWGAFAGLAGATVLYRKLATLMHDEPRPRASDRRPR